MLNHLKAHQKVGKDCDKKLETRDTLNLIQFNSFTDKLTKLRNSCAQSAQNYSFLSFEKFDFEKYYQGVDDVKDRCTPTIFSNKVMALGPAVGISSGRSSYSNTLSHRVVFMRDRSFSR